MPRRGVEVSRSAKQLMMAPGGATRSLTASGETTAQRITGVVLSPTRLRAAVEARVRGPYRRAIRSLSSRRLASLGPAAKVQLGAGDNHLDGWLNVDIRGSVRPDLLVDLRGGLPAPPGSIRFAYSEHLIEHLELDDARRLLADFHRSLEPGGVVRIAMPDLEELVGRYQGRWREQSWLHDPAYAHIDTPAHMLNVAMRAWGHKYVYDEGELVHRLREAGFTAIERCAPGESSHAELRGLETRDDSLLVVEATKGGDAGRSSGGTADGAAQAVEVGP